MDACKQFEAYFIEQMYKGMMKTIPTNENNSNYTATMMDYYKDQMVQAVAEETTDQNGGFGLAHSPWVRPLPIPTQTTSLPSVIRFMTV